MINRVTYSGPAAAAALVILLGLVLGVCQPRQAHAAEDPAGDEAPKKPVTIVSDTMEASSGDRLVIFRGDVVAEEDFLLCSDELRIVYGEGNEVQDITATGRVRIFYEDRVAECGVAVYDRNERKLVLTEDPVVKQCGDMVRGDRITFYLDDERALVESGGQGRVRALIMPEGKCPETADTAGDGASGETRCKRPR